MAYCYPTMEQWHMKSVPLPLLEGLDLRYHPGLRYLKCTICNVFVNPRSAPAHTANVHWYYMATNTRKQVEDDFPNPEWTKPYPQLPPGVPLPPFDDLPIVPVYKCILDDCEFISDNTKSMYNHLSSKHHCQPSDAAFVPANVTKLVIGRPQVWIAVSGDITHDSIPEVKPPEPEEGVNIKVDIRHQPSALPRDESKRRSRRRMRDPTQSSSVCKVERPGYRSPAQQWSSARSKENSASPSVVPLDLDTSATLKCPTMDEYLTPCVQHPVLDATGLSMRLHPGIGLIQCGTCQTFLAPSQVCDHYRERHQHTIPSTLSAPLVKTFADPTWSRPFPDIGVGDGFARIKGLPVTTSVQCTYNGCGDISPSMASHRTHFTMAHPSVASSSYQNHTLSINASQFMYKDGAPIWIPIAADGRMVEGVVRADTDSGAESDDISRDLHASLDTLDYGEQVPPKPVSPAPAPVAPPRRRVMARRSKPLPPPTPVTLPQAAVPQAAVSQATVPQTAVPQNAVLETARLPVPMPKATPLQPAKSTPARSGPATRASPVSKRKVPASLKRTRSVWEDQPMESPSTRTVVSESGTSPTHELDFGFLTALARQTTDEQDLNVVIGRDRHGRICVKEIKMVDVPQKTNGYH